MTSDFDLKLDVLNAVRRPGERIPTRTIAEICGCSHTLVYIIEQQALRKMRERMRRGLGMSHAQMARGGDAS